MTTLYDSLSDKDVRQDIVMDAVKFGVGTSFRASMNALRRTKSYARAMGQDIFPGGNDKLRDRAFGEALGIAVPKTYKKDARLEDVELIPRTILKPLKGSSSLAVFYVDDSCTLHSVRSSKTYASLAEADREIRRYKDHITVDRWVVEEAILDAANKLANDFKVYSFYGFAGMFLEIDRSSSAKPRYATYNANGEVIKRNSREITFEGTGVPPSIYELSNRISLASPVPFLRLDFHIGAEALYLGEITPHPGGVHAGAIYEELDQRLGRYFAEAEARLYLDLLNGKTFPEFRQAYGL
ncbi:ATP-grasp fold amidoligase family protein [Enteractinococcus fodinae]|uniref:ATP-grasp domain-containing protein n=1 Tax=Enteractinococcus fodinae TaxID=684663 RepID=A0ABU2B0I3_9MICC|nr:ATP-grasp fold amidoligase family protein [Enteractinococcus fodinae]MDR7346916.1 hypothetical protein [Enteractinococcus fodinae]